MAKHLSLRLAWHDGGWNGKICKNPAYNTFCVGQSSYPGDMIKSTRVLGTETNAEIIGRPCSKIDYIPPCVYSINAFGLEDIKAYSDPPDWFYDSTKRTYFDLTKATACTWPYEEMYGEDILREDNTFDYDKRLSNAKNYFKKYEPGKSLIFYYSNYSNPFSEDDSKTYVIVGISRLAETKNIMFYENVSEQNKKKYAGGFIWQMPVKSNYPDEGFCLPYHIYFDQPEVLDRIVVKPDNPRCFKYATREISNDDALSIVERMLEVVSELISIGDKSQDWVARKNWLLSVLSELWKNRGAYPGLPQVLEHIGFNDAVIYYKEQTEKGKDKEAFDNIFKLLNKKVKNIKEFPLKQKSEFIRNWELLEIEKRKLLQDVLPRFDLTAQQISNIISEKRIGNSLYSSLRDIAKNPYVLSEEYVGDDIDDIISFYKIDHGVLPSPELGLDNLYPKNSKERFRSLCVEQLKKETVHTFSAADVILHKINNKLASLPEWKKNVFTSQYFNVDKEFLEKSLFLRDSNGTLYLYLKYIYNAERLIEKTIRNIANRKNISFRSEINENTFYNFLFEPESRLNAKAEKEYIEAIKGQAYVCSKIFSKPICVISGAAGTGKTTIIKALIKAIENTQGEGASFYLLAPTGKATERIKEKTGKPASTIHSLLASNNWLNENFTLKLSGGKISDTYTTLIIDETSMVDLELFAALFRSIDWNSVQRLILVGDPNQLPPIGKGKIFFDIINFLKAYYPDKLAKLQINVRHLENKINDKGNGILDLAEIFIQENQKEVSIKRKSEIIFKKIQNGGVIDKDLEVIYWRKNDDLEKSLKKCLVRDLEEETGLKYNEDKSYELWSKANNNRATFIQFLSPYRGEYYGTENINILIQELFNNKLLKKCSLQGISIFDKVIQIRNRPKSNKIFAYNLETRRSEKIEIYNGEIGFVKPHAYDNNKWKSSFFRLKQFQVVFDRKNKYWVEYKESLKDNSPETNLELAYAISVHKAQGSEFGRVYFILPDRISALVCTELMYTAITRAQKHLTILIQNDISTILKLNRLENSAIRKINSSSFDFNPLPEEIITNWFEEGKNISTLSEYYVRSKSEMNIANILTLNDIKFEYEKPLFAPDGSMYLPDFTIMWQGEEYYWEHVGLLNQKDYLRHWEEKEKWYKKHFPDKLIVTYESKNQSKEIEKQITKYFS